MNIYIQEPIDLYLSQKILKRKFSDFGGCRAWALYKTGNFLATDPFCFKKDCLEIINVLPTFEEKKYLNEKEGKQILFLTTKFMKPILEKSGITWDSKILENDLKTDQDKFWLLKFKSKLAGYLWFTENNSQVYLKSVIIDNPYQKEHFGTFLIKRLELYARKNHKKKILFAVQTSNKKSFNFFKQLGYKRINKDKHKGFIFSKKFSQTALS